MNQWGANLKGLKNRVGNKLASAQAPREPEQVGQHRVFVGKLIAEGGFAYVYTATTVDTGEELALKRINVPDLDRLPAIKREVDIMRALPRHHNIITFVDADVHEAPHEAQIVILMEMCKGGGLIDYMNSRHGQRFSESEIMSIFAELCDAVAVLHALDPPIAHRDLKVENLLRTHAGEYKLCDFGSCTTRHGIPRNSRERSEMEDDIQANTTMSYRAPEMCDLYSDKPLSEKVDIWALGCVLYKLAFFETPFEDGTALQILNNKWTIPPTSPYSAQLHGMMKFMLNPDPVERPDVWDVIERVAAMRGVPSASVRPPPRARAPEPADELPSPPSPRGSVGGGNLPAPPSPPGAGSFRSDPAPPPRRPSGGSASMARPRRPSGGGEPPTTGGDWGTTADAGWGETSGWGDQGATGSGGWGDTPPASGGGEGGGGGGGGGGWGVTPPTGGGVGGWGDTPPAPTGGGGDGGWAGQWGGTAEASPWAAQPAATSMSSPGGGGWPQAENTDPWGTTTPASAPVPTPAPTQSAGWGAPVSPVAAEGWPGAGAPLGGAVLQPQRPSTPTNSAVPTAASQPAPHAESLIKANQGFFGSGMGHRSKYEPLLLSVTKSSTDPPLAKDVDGVIALTWQGKKTGSFYASFEKRPISSDLLVGFKGLSLVHTALLRGSPAFLKESAAHSKLFTGLLQWQTRQAQAPYLAPLLVAYSKFIFLKISFHSAHPEIEGNFSLDSFLRLQKKGSRLGPGSTTFLTESFLMTMLELLSSVLDVQRAITTQRQAATIGALVECVAEAGACVALLRHIMAYMFLLKGPSVLHRPLARFGAMVNTLSTFLTAARSSPAIQRARAKLPWMVVPQLQGVPQFNELSYRDTRSPASVNVEHATPAPILGDFLNIPNYAEWRHSLPREPVVAPLLGTRGGGGIVGPRDYDNIPAGTSSDLSDDDDDDDDVEPAPSQPGYSSFQQPTVAVGGSSSGFGSPGASPRSNNPFESTPWSPAGSAGNPFATPASPSSNNPFGPPSPRGW